jgi:hypothetical protein
MIGRISLLIPLAFCCLSAQGADAGYATKAIDLLERPDSQARIAAKLAKKQPLEIIGRDGSWANVKTGYATGWVRLADLRLNVATLAAQTPRRQNTGTKDTGIRGFSEEELLVGAPNQAESERLKRMGVSVPEAVSFARAANLRPRQQDYIQMQEYMPEGGFSREFFDE